MNGMLYLFCGRQSVQVLYFYSGSLLELKLLEPGKRFTLEFSSLTHIQHFGLFSHSLRTYTFFPAADAQIHAFSIRSFTLILPIVGSKTFNSLYLTMQFAIQLLHILSSGPYWHQSSRYPGLVFLLWIWVFSKGSFYDLIKSTFSTLIAPIL